MAGTFQSLTIDEQMNGHHTFQLALPARGFGAGVGTGSWRELVGKRITIEINPRKNPSAPNSRGYDAKLFTGLITGLQLGKGHGPNGHVVLTGGAPTLLLDDDPHTQSFSGRSLKAIAESELGHYPANLLRPKVNPQTTNSLTYVVQYKENTWAFLRRLARTHGEWFYYDGEHVVFGRRQPETITLTHDVDLDDFNLEMNIRSANMQLSGYDYGGDRVAQSDTSAPSGLNAHSQAAVDAGKGLFPRKGRYPSNQPLNGQSSGQIKTTAERQATASVAGMVTMSGRAHHPGVSVGNHIAVEEAIYGSENYGEYMLTSVQHHCSSDGDYSNSFRGIPADAAAPPHRLDDHPQAGPQSAVVMDNNDPDDLGRVQVQLRWQEGRTPWLRMVQPAGGGGKGFYMIPEKGEEVMVDFEGGNPEKPYVLGATWNGSGPAGFGTPKNDIKAIKTRSGHTIELNDKSGGESIIITDKKDNIIELDTANGNIKISAPEDLKISAKNVDINAKEKLSMGAEDISSSAGKQHMMMAKNMNIHADEEMLKTAKKMESTADAIKQNSTKENLTLFSNKSVDLKSNEKVKLF